LGLQFIQKYSLNTFYLSGTVLATRDTSQSKAKIVASDSTALLLRDYFSSWVFFFFFLFLLHFDARVLCLGLDGLNTFLNYPHPLFSEV